MLRFVLLGDPVAHSLSPRLQAAALAAAQVEGSYTARRVDEAGMREAVEELRAGHLDGANVTMPHKLLAAQLADTLGPDAARTGAVNTLVTRQGTVAGMNTDVEAIRMAWGVLPQGPVLILGSGGAAAAALLALANRPTSVSARRSDVARQALSRLDLRGEVIPWGEPLPGAVIVNATPIGMGGESLPPKLLAEASGLFDMPYRRRPTPALERAKELGIPAVAGVEMLIAQAALSFRIWTGFPGSFTAMRAVLDDHSAGSNL